jgi:ribose-phosphate pyrophosphokinase
MRVEIKQQVAKKDVFLFQTFGKAPNECLIETLLMVDALRRGGAARITLVAPYLAYSRQSVQEAEGESVAARLFADFLQMAGVSSLVTLDLHSELVRSFFAFPAQHLTARRLFAERIKQRKKEVQNDLVVVGPDLGGAKLAAKLAFELSCDLALIEKKRIDARQVKMLSLLGEVKGKTVLLADDVCSTARTLTSAAICCREKGAKQVFAAVTHGLFVESALDLINDSPIETLFVTDTIPQEERVVRHPKICVVSIAEYLASALGFCSSVNTRRNGC